MSMRTCGRLSKLSIILKASCHTCLVEKQISSEITIPSDGYSESSISENFIRSHLLVYNCFLSGKAINRLSEQELSTGVFFWSTVLATSQWSKILGSIISADCDVCATGAWLGLARYTFCLRPHPHELREGRLLTITYCIIAVKTVY